MHRKYCGLSDEGMKQCASHIGAHWVYRSDRPWSGRVSCIMIGKCLVVGMMFHDRKKSTLPAALGLPESRAKECFEGERRGYRPATLIHPSVIAARHVQIGEGTVIGARCVLAPYAILGRHCALNIGVTVGHDSRMGDFSVFSPGAQLLGAAELSERVFLGANATVYPKRKVGAGSIIAANSLPPDEPGPGFKRNWCSRGTLSLSRRQKRERLLRNSETSGKKNMKVTK